MIQINTTEKPKPYNKIKKYKENPFHQEVQPFQIKKRKMLAKESSQTYIGKTTGDVIQTVFYKYDEVDSQKFVKVFDEGLERICNLSKKALKVLNYIIVNLKPNQDNVVISIESEEIKHFTGYTSKASLYGGLAELIARGLIARSNSHNMFFINPACIFNGRREMVIIQHIRGPKIVSETGEELIEEAEYSAENTENGDLRRIVG